MTRLARLFRRLILITWLHLSSAAHSRRRVVAFTRDSSDGPYDRSITTFDPTGRLLQVEYGLTATMRGESISAVLQDDGSILVLVSRPANNGIAPKVHRIDEHLWLFTAGLSGDSRFLASRLRSMCRKHRSFYGEPMTVEEAARDVSHVQHLLTRQAGYRPLGCTAIVVGMDFTSSNREAGMARIFRTDPGGILEDCLYCCAGKDQERHMITLRKTYDSIRTCNTFDSAQLLLSSFREDLLAAEQGPAGFDLWLFRPKGNRRGKAHTTCFLDIGSPESLNAITTHLNDGPL
jgi:20S proteasome alpha/beta subunit